MEIVEQHIRHLLNAERSLIIPRMGGFVITGKPEAHRTNGQTENMTEESIEFNDALQHNDGVLAERISESERVSYDEAMDSIEGFVHHVRVSLEKDGAYLIDQVGTFYLDQQQNIRFNPWEAEVEQAGFQITAETAVLPKSPAKRILARIAVLSVVAVTGWFHFTMSYRLYEWSAVTVGSNPGKDRIAEIRSTSPVGSAIPQQVIPQKAEVTAAPESKNATPQQPRQVSSPINGSSYYVVAGAFKSTDNANRKLRELQALGFDGATVFVNDRGLHLVAYGTKESTSVANDFKAELNAKGLEARLVRR